MEPVTIHGLLEVAARDHPDRTALIDDSASLTYSDWWRSSLHLASILHKGGVRPGEIVGVLTTRSNSLPVSFAAVSLLGARFVVLNQKWPPQERERVFERWPERFLLVMGPGFELDIWNCDTGRILNTRVELPTGDAHAFDRPEPDGDVEVYLNVTSASTGLAKVAATTHRQLIANTSGICHTLGLRPDDVHMSLFGVIGHPHELFLRGLFLRGTTVLTDHSYPRNVLEAISRHGVTALMGLPPQLESLGRLCSRDDVDISKLRLAEAGGMYVSAVFMELFQKRTAVDLFPVWGSTETSGVVLTGEPGREGFSRIVGGYTVQLRGSDGSVIPGNGRGELWISGTGVVSRYLGDRSATAGNFINGWYGTGDVFSCRNGVLHFLGRRGGLIKAAGLKVYPLEVELAILRHPDVTDVCVIGEDHPVRGEIPAAFILTRPGSEISSSGLRRFLQPHLDEHKIPRIVNFVSGFPRTPNGKIDRKAVGKQGIEPDYRGELLRSDVELVRLLNLRAELIDRIGGGFDPTWVEEQIANAIGHNPGPISDGLLREMIMDIINAFGKR